MTRPETSPCICLVSQDYPPHPGGLAVAARRVAGHLLHGGFRVHVVVPDDGAGSTETTEEDGLVVHRVRAGPPGMASYMELSRYVRALDSSVDFDLFHGFFLPAASNCVGAARRLKNGRRRPMIASIRGTDATTLLRHPRLRPVLLQALNEATWVTSVNQVYLEDLGAHVDVTGRSSVIRNGAAVLPATWSLSDANRGVIGSSGKFRKVKDIPLLVRAFHQAADTGAQRLLLVGTFSEPIEEQWSWQLAQEFGLAERVELTGHLAHADALAQLQRMHIYVQCSAFEGMPNALLEAASTGVPLVATAVGGMREVFTDGVDALLVPHGDPVALAGAISRILTSDALAQKLAKNASKLCALHSHERERQEWVDLHWRLLEDGPAA